MNVKEFEKKEKNTAELTVVASPEEFEAAINKAFNKNKSKISLPGFRKGKANRKIVEAMYGESVFYDDAAEELYPTALQFGVEQEKLSTVGRPAVLSVNVEDDKSLTIKFLVSLYPEITIEGYKGISAPKPSVRVLKKDVEREIAKTREQNARIQTVEREAKNGDIVKIDFEGFMDGTAFEGGKGEGYDLELGTGTFIPGFEEQLVGTKAGDKVDVNVTFPEAYAPELAGKDATFKVTVHEVKEKILPELDDEFAKDVSEFDTYDEYFASVKDSITESRKADAEKSFQDVILQRLVDKVEGDIPDAMIEDQVENMLANFRYSLAAQGIELEQYCKMLGTSLDEMKNELRPTAEKEIKADLAFEAIAKKENFEITNEQIEEEYKKMAEQYGMDVESVKKAISPDVVKTNLNIDAAKALVYSEAVAEKKEKKTESEEGQQEEEASEE